MAIGKIFRIKQYTGYEVSSLRIQNELDFYLKGSVWKSSLMSFERVMAHYYYILQSLTIAIVFELIYYKNGHF